MDYLPFFCNKCTKNLCKEHYHNPIECPFALNIQNETTKVLEQHSKREVVLCSFCNKSVGYSKEISCKFCNKSFCLTHRLESDHNCEKIKSVNSENKTLKEKANMYKNKVQEKMAELKKKYNK